jgi:hypothetical protein
MLAVAKQILENFGPFLSQLTLVQVRFGQGRCSFCWAAADGSRAYFAAGGMSQVWVGADGHFTEFGMQTLTEDEMATLYLTRAM